MQGLFHQTAVRALTSLGVHVQLTSPVPRAPWPLRRWGPRWAQYAATPHSYHDGAVPVTRPRYVAIPSRPSWSRPEIAFARAALGSVRSPETVSIIHSHFAFPSAVAGRLVAARLGRPHVVTVHGSDVNTWPSTHSAQLPQVIEALRSADALIAVSSALADRTEALCGRRPDVLPIGIDVQRFSSGLPPRAIARDRLGIAQDDFVVLFVGDLIPSKGARRLVDAIQGVGVPMLCLLVGSGPDAGYRANEPGRRAQYLGVKSNLEVGLFMRAADAVVLPSESEGLPAVLVEAGAVGTFVVASAVGGIPELIGNGRGLILPDTSSSAISAALEEVANDPERRSSSEQALQAHVRERYDARNCAMRLIDLYSRVLADWSTSGR